MEGNGTKVHLDDVVARLFFVRMKPTHFLFSFYFHKEFNNWEEIREALNPFLSLRITLSGTSAVSASTVYGEHVYEFDDVCVGWRFANMVYEKKEKAYKSWWRRLGLGRGDSNAKDEVENHDTVDTRTKIDAALLHDIVPQPGGDFEPLEETNNINQGGRMMLKIITLGIWKGEYA